MRGEIISIGTELMTGVNVDTNSAWLSKQLGLLGVSVIRHTTVGDDLATIVDAFRQATQRADLVISTGGLGPTLDDMTRDALAELVGQPLEMDEQSLAVITEFFAAINREMTANNRQQAMYPRGATVLPNQWGTAPGIQLTASDAVVFSFPGVPREMQGMFGQYVVPHVTVRVDHAGISRRVLRTCGLGESSLADKITDLMVPGRNPAIGTTASESIISIQMLAKAGSAAEAERLIDDDVREIKKRLGSLIFGEEDDTLESVTGKMLAGRNQTLSTAESCTGGLIGKMITDVSGSSTYYLGGFVTYSNEQKIALLGVPEELIAAHGAVSEEVARAMADGCRKAVGSDYALSVTGVAGPTGGTEAKPVGLIFIGLAGPSGTTVIERRFRPTAARENIRGYAARTALNSLRTQLSIDEPN